MELVDTISVLTKREESVDTNVDTVMYPVVTECLDYSDPDVRPKIKALLSGDFDIAEGVLPC